MNVLKIISTTVAPKQNEVASQGGEAEGFSAALSEALSNPRPAAPRAPKEALSGDPERPGKEMPKPKGSDADPGAETPDATASVAAPDPICVAAMPAWVDAVMQAFAEEAQPAQAMPEDAGALPAGQATTPQLPGIVVAQTALPEAQDATFQLPPLAAGQTTEAAAPLPAATAPSPEPAPARPTPVRQATPSTASTVPSAPADPTPWGPATEGLRPAQSRPAAPTVRGDVRPAKPEVAAPMGRAPEPTVVREGPVRPAAAPVANGNLPPSEPVPEAESDAPTKILASPAPASPPADAPPPDTRGEAPMRAASLPSTPPPVSDAPKAAPTDADPETIAAPPAKKETVEGKGQGVARKEETSGSRFADIETKAEGVGKAGPTDRTQPPIVAQMRDVAAGAQPAEATAPKAPAAADPHHVVSQIVEGVRMRARDGQTSMSLRLEPPNLGSVRLELRMDRDVVHLRIQVQSEAVREVVTSNLPQLREALAREGLNIQSFSLSSDGNAGAFAREHNPQNSGERRWQPGSGPDQGRGGNRGSWATPQAPRPSTKIARGEVDLFV